MLKKIKKELYLRRKDLLLEMGYKQGKIVPFDEEVYSKMRETYFDCMPISMYIKFLNPLDGMLGKCFDRSLCMFFCFDDAFYVCGDSKDLEVQYGKSKSRHGWVEIGDYVYDPSMLLRFEKDLYYKIYMPGNVTRLSKEQYCSEEESYNFYSSIKGTTVDDFKPYGKRRLELFNKIPLIKDIAKFSGREDFVKELDEYLTLIEYDEDELVEEVNSKIEFYCKVKK